MDLGFLGLMIVLPEQYSACIAWDLQEYLFFFSSSSSSNKNNDDGNNILWENPVWQL